MGGIGAGPVGTLGGWLITNTRNCPTPSAR